MGSARRTRAYDPWLEVLLMQRVQGNDSLSNRVAFVNREANAASWH